jgi:radical SAM protein with 4Fe4S-binding SPASM domain
MDEDLYLAIVKELSEINYDKTISYSRYNEPLSQREIFIKRILQAHELVPRACLHTNTNGDYLTNREYLDDLYSTGLASMHIQCYLGKQYGFDVRKIKKRIEKKREQLKLDCIVICDSPERYEVAFDYKDMNLRMYARDFEINGSNRGGSLQTIKGKVRKKPCFIPFTDIYVDYNGNVVPCCNFRSDNKAHEKFVLGSAVDSPVLSIFNGTKMKKLRNILREPNIELYPCNECNFAVEHKLV